MLQWLRRSGKTTWLIGMAVSQVFALHVVLASMVASHMAIAPGDAAAICLTDKAADQDIPAKPHRQMTCAICAFASLGAPLPGGDATVVVPVASEFVRTASLDAGVGAYRQRDPRCSQGPPTEL